MLGNFSCPSLVTHPSLDFWFLLVCSSLTPIARGLPTVSSVWALSKVVADVFLCVGPSCEGQENGGSFYRYDSDHHICGPQALCFKQRPSLVWGSLRIGLDRLISY